MEHNANHIISSYGHLPVSCISLVDWCGSLGSCKPQMYSILHIYIQLITGTLENLGYVETVILIQVLHQGEFWPKFAILILKLRKIRKKLRHESNYEVTEPIPVMIVLNIDVDSPKLTNSVDYGNPRFSAASNQIEW